MGLSAHLVVAIVLISSGLQECGRSSAFELFDFDSQQCCNGTVYQTKPDYSCCGINYHDVNESMCCGNQLVPYPPNGQQRRSHMNCCRNENGLYFSYDDSVAKCCAGRIVPIPAVELRSGEQGHRCCGQNVYLPTAQRSCCNQQVIEKAENDNSVCCGTLGHVVLHAGQECCGSQIIDTSREVCCKKYNYRDYAKPVGSSFTTGVFGIMVSNTMYRVHQKAYGGSTECCGLEVYDRACQVCCQSRNLRGPKRILALPREMHGTVAPRQQVECCGDVVLTDMATQQCCDWKTPYDPRSQECCGGRIVAVDNLIPHGRPGSNSTCCWPSGDFYNDESHFCCDAGVFLRTSFPKSNNPGCCKPDIY